MVKRTVCLYNGTYIGIEEIFTVVNGRQVNLPGKVEWLRKLGRENQLFCPCGCSNNLMVVAGDSGLRDQHFRIKDNANEKLNECVAIHETDESILSKIALKCWLDEKVGSEAVCSRVMLKEIIETERRFELSFYSKKRNLALCFWNKRNDIDSEKIDFIDQCKDIKSKIYVVSDLNSGATNIKGQYPEFMIKLHKAQGYSLYLQLKTLKINKVYDEAILKVNVFVRCTDGSWQERPVLSASLKDYHISSEGNLMYNGRSIEEYIQTAQAETIKQKAKYREYIKKTDDRFSQTLKKANIDIKSKWEEPERDETPEEKMARKIRENDEWNAEQDAIRRRRKGLYKE